MTSTVSATIVGKWKLVETCVDLDMPKPVSTRRQGEVIEFTADGRLREPGRRESRAKSFGSVMYRLNTQKNPPHFDTFYASGITLRTGIYRLAGDRLVLCWIPTGLGGRRPSKFGGFTRAEENRLRSVDVYERVTKGAPRQAAPRPVAEPPSARLLETKRLLAYLRKGRKTPPRKLGAGLETEWIPLAELEVASGSLWVGDPLGLNEQDGCVVKLAAGTYVLAAQGMEFDGFRVVGRVRAYPKDQRTARLKTGSIVGKTGTDSAAITVCDLRRLLPMIAGQEAPVQRALAKQLRGRCGLLTSKLAPAVALPFVQSGFGDGTGPVRALLANGRRVGLEHSFVER